MFVLVVEVVHLNTFLANFVNFNMLLKQKHLGTKKGGNDTNPNM